MRFGGNYRIIFTKFTGQFRISIPNQIFTKTYLEDVSRDAVWLVLPLIAPQGFSDMAFLVVSSMCELISATDAVWLKHCGDMHHL